MTKSTTQIDIIRYITENSRKTELIDILLNMYKDLVKQKKLVMSQNRGLTGSDTFAGGSRGGEALL